MNLKLNATTPEGTIISEHFCLPNKEIISENSIYKNYEKNLQYVYTVNFDTNI